jgi:hypothetical protein
LVIGTADNLDLGVLAENAGGDENISSFTDVSKLLDVRDIVICGLDCFIRNKSLEVKNNLSLI